ncbi:unnamed protein product [Leptidea sinapis]|uniref:Peptidoglycan recognition protein family domain-containing protein n=1 Tax=Leptidea sinapis TaxID=189913 RepID=A0A5E4QJT1_9NEOP|nr:unnamed protein product [Leptidea sinapis]
MTPLSTPVAYVVVHHTYLPPACNSHEECITAMRGMQSYHNSLGWGDIGYKLTVMDMLTEPKQSLPLTTPVPYVVIHHSYLPPACSTREQCSRAMTQMQRMHVDTRGWWDIGYKGYIKLDYKLVGHRQVRDTKCPGDTLFREISQWKHFSSFPASKADLINVLFQIVQFISDELSTVELRDPFSFFSCVFSELRRSTAFIKS